MREQDASTDTETEQSGDDISENARLAIEKAQNYAGYDKHKRSRAVNLITKADSYKCDEIIKLFLEPAELLQLHDNGFSCGENPIESDLAKELIRIRSLGLSRLLKFVSLYEGKISYIIIQILHKNGNLSAFAEILRKMDEQDYRHFIGLFMEMPPAEYLESINKLFSEKTEKLAVKISALLPKHPKTTSDPEAPPAEKCDPAVTANPAKGTDDPTPTIAAETKEKTAALISSAPEKDPFLEDMFPLAKNEREHLFEKNRLVKQAIISGQPYAPSELLIRLERDREKLEAEQFIKDRKRLAEKTKAQEEQKLRMEKYYQEAKRIKVASHAPATVQPSAKLAPPPPISPPTPPSTPAIPQTRQILRPPPGALNKTSNKLSRRTFFGAIAGALALAVTYAYCNQIPRIIKEIEKHKDRLIEIGDAFKDINLMTIAGNPSYYTDLLIEATEIIDKIIALIAKIAESKLCVPGDHLNETRTQCDNVIRRFRSGDANRLLKGAYFMMRAKAAGSQARQRGTIIINWGRRKIDGLFGPGTTNGVIEEARDWLKNTATSIPGVEDAMLIKEKAQAFATVVVALANFILAAEKLVIKIEALEKSTDTIECKGGELSGLLITAVAENPVKKKQEKAIEAIGLAYVLEPGDAWKDDVKKLQKFLVEHEYLQNPNGKAIDGNYAGGTLQAKNQLLNMLKTNLQYAKKKCANPTSTTVPSIKNNPSVTKLQRMLKQLGYLNHDEKTDGEFTQATNEAFNEFTLETRGKSLCEAEY